MYVGARTPAVVRVRVAALVVAVHIPKAAVGRVVVVAAAARETLRAHKTGRTILGTFPISYLR